MNTFIQKQLKYRSIRKYQDKAIEKEKAQLYLEVMRRTACRGSHAYSVIRIADQQLKHRIAEAIKQDYVKALPELMIFVIDLYRSKQIANLKAPEVEHHFYFDQWFVSIGDTYLAAQNMMNAIEADGLGGLFLSTVADNVPVIRDLLSLPELTFPIIGLGFGYPAEDPELSPRLPLDIKVSTNTYGSLEGKYQALCEYDTEIRAYQAKVRGGEGISFTEATVNRVTGEPSPYAYLLNDFKDAGVDLCIRDVES